MAESAARARKRLKRAELQRRRGPALPLWPDRGFDAFGRPADCEARRWS
jgi:hypothetical protein